MKKLLMLLTAAFFLYSIVVRAGGQAQLAVPSDIKQVNLNPPKAGRLVQMRGLVVTEGNDLLLVDTESRYEIRLDFSKSKVQPALKAAGTKVAIDVTGRIRRSKDYLVVLEVIGFIELDTRFNQADNLSRGQ